jgi:hypothetical protein
MGEDVEHELADVVVHPAACVDGRDDGGEVVIGQHHRGGFARDVGARPAHRDADVGVPECRCVVDPVPGHGDDFAARLQRLADAQLGLGRGAREHDLARPGDERVEPGSVEGIELSTAEDGAVGPTDADGTGDRRGGEAIVTGDDVDAHTSAVCSGNGRGDAGPWRVDHGDQSEERELRFGLLAVGGVAVHRVADLAAGGVVELLKRPVRGEQVGAQRED